MKQKIKTIEMDSGIQCRAVIDTETVTDYAERMAEGDAFPAVVLFGNSKRCWIGDGWHRVMAAQQTGAADIEADLRPGGRMDALKFALGANAANGLRRSNRDKRRAVEIALREFPDLSSRAVAELCGVGVHMVSDKRQVCDSHTSPTVTGSDGKQYPARKSTTYIAPDVRDDDEHETRVTKTTEVMQEKMRPIGPPCDGMQFAHMAIMDLKQIKSNDSERNEAFETVKGWINENE